VGRTLLSVAFDLDVAVDADFDFDFDREGHGFSRAEIEPPKSTRLQPLRAGLAVGLAARNRKRPVCPHITSAVKNEVRKKHGLLPPEKIAAIRAKLELTQSELEDVLGTGPKMVVRWESGKVIQSRGHDNMLRLLDRDPGTLKSLRQIQALRSAEQDKYAESASAKMSVARV